ncbi:MAG: hypothetical protein AAB354_11135, partial [candidate division KSB1 bacterium]
MPHRFAPPAAHEQGIEYPLRQPYDQVKFYLGLIFLPAFVVTLVSSFFAGVLFERETSFSLFLVSARPLCFAFSPSPSVIIATVHFLSLLVFLWLLWVPIQLSAYNLWDWVENVLLAGRTIALVVAIRFLFPHDLVLEFLDEKQTRPLISRGYETLFLAILLGYCLFSIVNNSRKAFGDVRRAAAPDKRSRSDRWLWFDAFSIFFVFFAMIVVELYFLGLLRVGDFTTKPYDDFKMSRRVRDAVNHGAQVLAAAVSKVENAQSFKKALEFWANTRKDSVVAASVFSDSTLWRRAPAVARLPSGMQQKLLARLLQAEKAEERRRQQNRMLELAWLSCAILSALIFFVLACLPNRLMHATLIPVTFHERDMKGAIFKAHRYLYHFVRAMLLKNPLLMLGGLAITAIFLIAPVILAGAGRWHHLNLITQADEIILALAVFLSWFIPLAVAAVSPDDTFGEYFNQRLANHLMMIQGHLVFIGHGDLGKRVLDREINRFEVLARHPAKKRWEKLPLPMRQLGLSILIRLVEIMGSAGGFFSRNRAAQLLVKLRARYNQPQRPNYKKAFLEIVTPDLRLEKMCGLAVVIERDLKDVVYSSTHPLLGDYGAVGACRKDFKSKDARGNVIHPEKRLLVPILRGQAREPFISSRVNLERASLVISMVPDEESVQAVFERANKANVSSIICVSRSDQISYLTYRSRHRPIVLVYPKENQGITLGERLWAAMQKVRAVRRMAANDWPKVLVLGNNKANHYMLERLWTYLPGTHAERSKLVERNFSFIVTEAQVEQAHPILKAAGTRAGFDQSYPATYITSARFPYPVDLGLNAGLIHAVTRAVNTADIRALEACLEERQPDILMINHEDVEKSLLMLSRCARALERIKAGKPNAFHLPLLLLAAARGDDWERRSLGDASRYYDAICKLHCEDLATDLSYPEHAHYDHLLNEQIGESIIDSLADVEEIIAGARTTLQDPLKAPSPEEVGFPDRPTKPKFIEVNGCLPNRAGALANYLAELSGISFTPKPAEEVEIYWQEIGAPTQNQNGSAKISAHLPSFQYLRDITLDPEREGFALSGYAALAPFTAQASAASKTSLVARVFANDGRRYAEKELDPDLKTFLVEPKLMEKKLEKMEEPLAPGVPQVLDRLTKRTAKERSNVGTFHKVLLDQQPDNTLGEHACPGMSICRIAAFQDYVVASNSLRLHNLAREPENQKHRDERLWHARNYACCAEALPESASDHSQSAPHTARIFCCCHGKDRPGLIALVLNTLLFRSEFRREQATGNDETDWVINIDYFKGMSCQNSNFSLNRLFGFFEKKPREKEDMQ